MTASDSVQLSRAGLMIELGRFADAARLLSAVLAAAPDSCRGWCLLSRAHLGTGDPAEAMLAARRASALDPANDWPFRLLSTALIGLDRGTEAVAPALEARRLAPHSWRSHVCLAQAAAAGGQLDLAAQAARAALAVAPDQADVHVTAGRVCLSRGDPAGARLRQEAALAIDPAHSGAINELGRISLQRRDPARAARHFLRAAQSAPGNGVFGRNAELALRYLALRLARPIALAALLCAVSCAAATAGFPALALFLLPAELPLTLWIVIRIRAVPRPGRRHLPRLVRATITSWMAAAAQYHKSDKAPHKGNGPDSPAALGPLGPAAPSNQFSSSPSAGLGQLLPARPRVQPACSRRDGPSPPVTTGAAHPALPVIGPAHVLPLARNGPQAAHSRQTGWPPRLSASWLRWCTRKQLEQVNSSA